MANPTQRHTKSRKRIRRSAISLKKIVLTKCSKCKKPIKPHTACDYCGFYKGKEAVKIKLKKSEIKERKKQEKENLKSEKKSKK